MGDQNKLAGPVGPIKQAWKRFLEVLADPWTALFLALTAGFFLAGQFLGGEKAKMAAALLQVLMAISSGVLGGRIASSLSSLMEEGILKARGKVSVRSLKTLYRHISSVENRLRSFLEKEASTQQNTEITKRNYEEIIGACRNLQDQATSSIDNWTDVVPEADIGGALDVVAELRAIVDVANENIDALTAQLNEARGKVAENQAEHENQLRQKEAELKKAQKDLATLNTSLSVARSVVGSPSGVKGVRVAPGTKVFKVSDYVKELREVLNQAAISPTGYTSGAASNGEGESVGADASDEDEKPAT